MIEMLILISGHITEFRYKMSYKDLYIKFNDGIFRFLQDEDNKSLRYYFKDEIRYI